MDNEKVKALHAALQEKRVAAEKAFQFMDMLNVQFKKAQEDAQRAQGELKGAVMALEDELALTEVYAAFWRRM